MPVSNGEDPEKNQATSQSCGHNSTPFSVSSWEVLDGKRGRQNRVGWRSGTKRQGGQLFEGIVRRKRPLGLIIVSLAAMLYGALEIGQSAIPIVAGNGVEYGFPFLGVLLLVAGIGVFNLREWARVLMILACGYGAFDAFRAFSYDRLPEVVVSRSVLIGLFVLTVFTLTHRRVKRGFTKGKVRSRASRSVRSRRREKTHEPELDRLRQRILEHEEQLFGMNLLFRGMPLIWKNNRQRLGMNKDDYGALLQRGKKTLVKTRQLLDELQENPTDCELLRQLELPRIPEDPISEEMRRRARILVKTYYRLFPGRPKEDPLTDEEVARLTEAALDKLEAQPQQPGRLSSGKGL
jgi:hypothetical protein